MRLTLHTHANNMPPCFSAVCIFASRRAVIRALISNLNKSNALRHFTFEALSLRPVVIVVSPLNALIKDQIRRTEEGNLKAAILSVKRKKITGDLQIDSKNGNLEVLKMFKVRYRVYSSRGVYFLQGRNGNFSE